MDSNLRQLLRLAVTYKLEQNTEFKMRTQQIIVIKAPAFSIYNFAVYKLLHIYSCVRSCNMEKYGPIFQK